MKPMLEWPKPPEQASPTGWWKVTTPEFELDTDLPPLLAMEGAEDFTHEIAALRAVMGAAPARYKRPVRIVVLADTLTFEQKFSRTTGALALPLADEYDLFLSGRPEKWAHRASLVEGASALVTHEMAHVVLRQYFPVQTRWFAEGMAQYLASYKWSPDGSQVELGLANLEAYQLYRHYRTIGLADMNAWGGASAEAGEASEVARYGYAWAFVHYLINREPETFGEVMANLAQGPAGVAALEQRFAARTAEYDEKVHAYMKTGEYRTITLPVPAQHAPASLEAMDAIEHAHVEGLLEQASRRFHR